jgi:hypothetical protein
VGDIGGGGGSAACSTRAGYAASGQLGALGGVPGQGDGAAGGALGLTPADAATLPGGGGGGAGAKTAGNLAGSNGKRGRVRVTYWEPWYTALATAAEVADVELYAPVTNSAAVSVIFGSNTAVNVPPDTRIVLPGLDKSTVTAKGASGDTLLVTTSPVGTLETGGRFEV